MSTISQFQSPLRYPGGKSSFTPLLRKIIVQNQLQCVRYFEPFAGGAGAALNLLFSETVETIHLNDFDYRIYLFWQTILNKNSEFLDEIERIPVSVEEWRKQKAIYSSYKSHTPFQVGFATFYLNRCNRFGIIKGAGPIGGFEQKSNDKIDARFPKENLKQRILLIFEKKEQIFIHSNDAIEFLRTKLIRGSNKSFAYIDPPYIKQGNRLYLDACKDDYHHRLAKYLNGRTGLNWFLSYDNDESLNKMYPSKKIHRVSDLLPEQKRLRKSEVVIFSDKLEAVQ